jgi:excisionase family DNA binding protein
MSNTPELPSSDEVELARRAILSLSQALHRGDAKTVSVSADGGESATVLIPRMAYDLFLEVLGQMAHGNAVTIVPVRAHLTTQQAADLLNVSRPFVIKLLDQEELAHHKVGTHRRIMAEELFAYKKRRDESSRRALAELSRIGQLPGPDFS